MTVLNPKTSPKARQPGPRWPRIALGAACLVGALIALRVGEPALMVLSLVLFFFVTWRPQARGGRPVRPGTPRPGGDGTSAFVWMSSGSDSGGDASGCGDGGGGGGDCG